MPGKSVAPSTWIHKTPKDLYKCEQFMVNGNIDSSPIIL